MESGLDLDASAQFHRAEYDALRSEILARQRAMDFILYFGLVGSAVVAAWLLSGDGPHPPVFWFGPFALSMLSFVTYQRKSNGTNRIGQYIKLIEKRYADKEIKGWENSGKPQRHWKYLSTWFYWFLLLSVTLMFAATHVGVAMPSALNRMFSV